jgi:uncharacterized protein YndB with AHSA1/START domain
METGMSERPTFVYVTYIAASPEKVWQALTDPDITEKYWLSRCRQRQGWRRYDGDKPERTGGSPRSDH